MFRIPPVAVARLLRNSAGVLLVGALFLGGCASTRSVNDASSVKNDNIPAVRYVLVIDTDCRLEDFAGKSVGELLVYNHDNLIFVNRSGQSVTVEFITPQVLDAGKTLVIEPDDRARVVVPKRKRDFNKTSITIHCSSGGVGTGPSIKVGDGP